MLARITAELAALGVADDYTDDCAHLPQGPLGAAGAGTALVTTDALVEGVHFDPGLDPRLVGRQAAVANLSDLAASGGAAGWLVWALSLPARWETRVAALARGFGEVAAAYGARVVGGNLSRTEGPAVVAVTAGGPLAGPRALRRDGARVGDTLYVSGPLGDAALGYLAPGAETSAARHAWRPHLAEAAALAAWPGCHAAMDISDGLLLDAARLGQASGLGVEIFARQVPVSPLYRRLRGEDREVALTGGEDYVLLFAADGAPPIRAWAIGRCVAALGLWVDGQPRTGGGYDHFASGA